MELCRMLFFMDYAVLLHKTLRFFSSGGRAVANNQLIYLPRTDDQAELTRLTN